MDCLTFRLRRRAYALGLEVVGAVGELPSIRHVPLAPPAVLGVAERRGDVVTVLDLPGLLDDELPEGPLCLVALAGPFAHFGFRLPASLALLRGVENPCVGEATCEVVDVAALVSTCVSGN